MHNYGQQSLLKRETQVCPVFEVDSFPLQYILDVRTCQKNPSVEKAQRMNVS